MSSNPLRLQLLLQKYLASTCTKQELKEFWQLMAEASENDMLDDELERIWEEGQAEIMVPPAVKEKLFSKILETAKEREIDYARLHRNPWPKRLAVAAVFIAVIITSYLFFERSGTEEPPQVVVTDKAVPVDVAPGKDGAILTLADGRKIVLDDAADGNVTEVAVKDGSTISYDKNAVAKVEYNTMSTPKGRQFSLVLADGSKVWLNAASSITFPTAFRGTERKVEITGEAYFEVAHNASQPFKVSVNGMEVEVLGTHFNINAYNDEAFIRTTLLEGSVRVVSTLNPNVSTIIKPGQQAELSTSNRQLSTINPNVEEVMAWKKGLFFFNSADLQSIMRQASRWYDFEVTYDGTINDKFSGEIGRNLNASELFKILESTGKLKIIVSDNNKVIVKAL